MGDSNQRMNLLACCLLILSILRRNKVEMYHKDTASTSIRSRDYLFFRYCPYAVRTFLQFFFRLQATPRPNKFPITRIKVMISWTAIDRFDRLSRLRAFPYWIAPKFTRLSRSSAQSSILSKRSRSSQSSGSFAIDRVAFPYDCPIL